MAGAVKNPSGLTAKQEQFAQAYVECGNASEAYRRAYSTENMKGASVHRLAHTVLRSPAVAARIEALTGAALIRHEVTVERIVEELAAIAFANMAEYVTVEADGATYVDLSGLARLQFAAISEVTTDSYMDGRGEDAREVKRVKVKLSDKQAALEKLGKHLGMWPAAGFGAQTGPIKIQIVKGDEDL
jgi:phage terminase small subunit